MEKKTADPLVRLVDRMMENFSLALTPLTWPVDVIPALNYLPHWLPGISFKQTAKNWNLINRLVAEIPYSFTTKQMRSENYPPSLVSKLIDGCLRESPDQQLKPQDEEAIMWATATLYGGGADTTVSSLTSFVLAMTKFPEVQRMAQEEIDQVLGEGRLPQFEDRDKLPYIEGIVKETMRWFPVAPLGVPHSTDEEIEYRGYIIPKGTLVIPSVWWFLHDPQVYEKPEVFDPSRYISPRNEPDPYMYCFGFGRRRCPGAYVADSSVFLGIAQILACFNIANAKDEKGVSIEPHVEGTQGVVSHPKPFPYTITPRSELHRDLIYNATKDFDSQEGNSDKLGDLSIIEDVLKE